jgi:aminomethyltransferase
MSKRTPLYDKHVKLGGKVVDFAGFELPIQYTSLIKEHEAVRTDVGIFDVSHMGEILIEGEGRKFINYLVCNDIENLKPGKIRYSPMLNEEGGVVDDLLIYCLDEHKYLLIVNASNTEKDYKWILDHKKYRIKITNLSEKYSQIAVQGPNSKAKLLELVKEEELPVKYYSFKENVDLLGYKCLVSRTGYTGEDGYEIYIDDDKGINELFDHFISHGVTPCGLGCRDTLRLEAGMPLYGHEMDDKTSPLDTSLEKYCKMDKEKFIGKDALRNKGKIRVGLKNLEGGILREGMPVYDGFEQVGHVTSGTYLPTCKGSYAMAIICKKGIEIGTQLRVSIRGKCAAVEVVALPFYLRKK